MRFKDVVLRKCVLSKAFFSLTFLMGRERPVVLKLFILSVESNGVFYRCLTWPIAKCPFFKVSKDLIQVFCVKCHNMLESTQSILFSISCMNNLKVKILI